MKRIFLYNTLIIIILIASCNKIDLDDPVDGTPVFSVSMTLNGDEKNWQAGVDDYYLYTDFFEDPLNVYTFTGLLRKEGCQTNSCGESLEIRIRDFQQVHQGLPNVEEALAPGVYLYAATSDQDTVYTYDTTYAYRVEFFNQSIFSGPSSGMAFWQLGDSAVSFEFSPVHLYSELAPEPEVTLHAIELSGIDSCISRQTQHIKMPGSSPCSVSILPELNINDSTLTLLASATGLDPFTYAWNNGTTTVEIQDIFQPMTTYSVTISDAGGCIASASYTPGPIVNPGIPEGCTARFSYEVSREIVAIDSTPVLVNDPFQFSRVTIIYTDQNGQIYRSDQHSQSGTTSFLVLDVEEFDLNEKNDPTKKLTISFQCTLASPNGTMVELRHGEAVWGVAYPD